LGPLEAAEYDDAVAGLTPVIERALGPEVMANRAVGRGTRRTTRLEPWRPARHAWWRSLERPPASWPGRERALLVADVRQCYASIRPEVLAVRLRSLGADPVEVTRVQDLLDRMGQQGVRGLPVGPAPSAVLANAVLSVVDGRLRRAGAPHVRWVDDIVVFTAGRREALRVLDAVRRGLDAVGLEPNPSKTEILGDRERIRERLLNLRPSTGGASAVG